MYDHVSLKMGEVECPTYATRAHPGVCIIIVNQEFEKFTNLPNRDGADTEYKLLKTTFGNLGFKVIPMFDATDTDILRKLEEGKRQL